MTTGDAGVTRRTAWRKLAAFADRANLTGRLTPTGNLILMYHSVGHAYGNPDGPITSRRLRDDLAYFDDRFRFVDLPDVLEAGDEPRLAVTFDDGYHDFCTDALPVLESLDVPATLFVIADLLNDDSPEPGQVSLDASSEEMLNADDVHELVDHELVTIGNHTATHPDLPSLDTESLREEVWGAQRALERRYGVTIDRFCYPGGKHDERARQLVAETHDVAVGVSMGFVHPPIDVRDAVTLPRVDGANPKPVVRWEGSRLGDLSTRAFRGAKDLFEAAYR
ncbi:polysaccharide deacetylase family protein [Halobacterium hubeiense]|uniref:polysaccharide deacetylase family protein n=1 Tax=Halobacterium hubeiense TaxID=1407499 RepID=UPI003C77D592